MSRAAWLVVAIGFAGACSDADTESDVPTFASDVATILHANCATCHRPGEAAPFPLISYADARKRAKQIAIVTESGYMPPWLPSPDGPALVGDRSLSAETIATLRRWADAGAPEGDASRAPAPPRWPEGWQLGEPDLVIRMTESFELPAEGRDIYRNFVIPAPSSEPRWVRTVEWRPINRAVIHHAVLFVDRSGGARARDAKDATPGFEGMSVAPAHVPDGQFVGWAPGRVPDRGSPNVAWKLDGRTDVVLQLHMRPTGRTEDVDVVLGIHFAQEPPTEHPVGIRLKSTEIDIPPGVSDYAVEDSYELPVELTVLGIYPHAHYLGKRMHGFATLPNGDTRELFEIPEWDFNWQDQYRFVEPIVLPPGSVLRMEYTFDNSSANPLNPHDPPRRVVHGEQSEDEMAELLLEVRAAEEDLPILWRDFARKVHADDVAFAERLSKAEPENPRWHAVLGRLATNAGRQEEAVMRFERVAELRPGVANPLANLGHAYLVDPSPSAAQRAAETLRRALAIEPNHVGARLDLGRALVRLGELEDAEEELEALLALAPGFAPARVHLGDLYVALGRPTEAAREFERALEANPEDARALWSLGLLRFRAGRADEAIALYRRALAVYPDETQAHFLLGLALEARGELDEAYRHLDTARRIDPDRTDAAQAAERLAAALRN